MASVNEPTTREWLLSLTEPGFILAKAMSYYIGTNLKAVFCRGQILAPLLRTQQLRDEAFGNFWIEFSSTREDPTQEPGSAEEEEEPFNPSEENQSGNRNKIQGSADLIPPILSQATGIVLDVGPGTGTQMSFLTSKSIRTIYGAEPCAGLHGELRRSAAEHGLGAKYRILPCSVAGEELRPALEREGLLSSSSSASASSFSSSAGSGEGVFDTIVCVRVLCSVPDPERAIKGLYGLLKPGGKILVVEHVVNPWRTAKGSLVARVLQGVYHALGWRWVMGDCCLNRDTEGFLRRAAERDGGWESVQIEKWFGRTVIPYIAGVLVKKSDL